MLFPKQWIWKEKLNSGEKTVLSTSFKQLRLCYQVFDGSRLTPYTPFQPLMVNTWSENSIGLYRISQQMWVSCQLSKKVVTSKVRLTNPYYGFHNSLPFSLSLETVIWLPNWQSKFQESNPKRLWKVFKNLLFDMNSIMHISRYIFTYSKKQ